MNEWKWHDEIVMAVLANEDVDSAVKKTVAAKQAEVNVLEKELKEEAANAVLLTAGLQMPEGSAGRRMAEAILEEMRENNPEAAKAADERIARRKAAEEAELNRICRQ